MSRGGDLIETDFQKAKLFKILYDLLTVSVYVVSGDIPWDSQSSEAIRSQYSKGNSLRVYGKVAEYFKVILEYGLELDPNKRKLSFLHVRDLLLAAPKVRTCNFKHGQTVLILSRLATIKF